MQYELRGVREGDLPYLARNLRAADVRELLATYGHTRFLGGLQRSVNASDEAGVIDCGHGGNPGLLIGIRQKTPNSAIIWACGTAEVRQHRKAFLTFGPSILKRWFEERPATEYFMNFTHASNTEHHKWLQWCGAELLPPLPMGPLGDLFRPFTIRRSKYV